MKYTGYWISQYGDIMPVTDQRHINQIIRNPEKFGFTLKEIKEIYRTHKERLFSEGGKSREEILIKLIEKGWIRIRYVQNQDFFTIQISSLSHNVKESIWDFAVGVTSKFDNISKFTGVKIMNLNAEILFSGDLNEIVHYKAFEEHFKYINKFVLIENFIPKKK